MSGTQKDSSFEIWRLVTSIYKIWHRQVEKKLMAEGMSIMEFRMLKSLNEKGPQPMVKLAETNAITQGWVTSLIDRLEHKGYVQRIRNQRDRRVIMISSTEEGSRFYRDIKEVHEGFIMQTLKFMDEKESKGLIETLHKIEEQLVNVFNKINDSAE